MADGGDDGGTDGEAGQWQEIQALVTRLEPRIIEMFQRNGVQPDAAAVILADVVAMLIYRWRDVATPEAWFLEMLESRAWRSRSKE